jgi:periplasmic divalent cation tolerance protein
MAAMLIYVTTGSEEEALRIGRAVVEERLAACANILPRITSIFHWDGTLQQEDEAVLILKTPEDRVDAVVARIKAVHSYSCPCIVTLPVTGGNAAFLNWIEAETMPR